MKRTPAAYVVLAFLVVMIPLVWGLYRSIQNSKPLFSAPAPAPAAKPAP